MNAIPKRPLARLRHAASSDLPFLSQMLFEAFFWRPTQPRPDFSEFAHTNPEYQKLLADWGRPGDTALIAEIYNRPVGAAWYRYWSDAVHSYGYVNAETPELGIGVKRRWRRQGIGRALLRALLSEAARQGVRQISLSVEPDNPARRLYESEGFDLISQAGGAWTMVASIQADAGHR